MKTTIHFREKLYELDLAIGYSISTSFSNDNQVKAFYAPDISIEPVRTDTFVGSTLEGGILNFKNLFINPHGNGTHTECVGHIAKEPFYIKDCLQKNHFVGQLCTIEPIEDNEDQYISLEQVKRLPIEKGIECIILRTFPNKKEDKLKDWSGTNPCYIKADAMEYLVNKGIQHFMIDMPSVDREEDEGKLLAHKYFWNYPSDAIRKNATITEMIFAPNEVPDGLYLVNIQIIPVEMDASPSNVVIFPLKRM